VLKRLPRGCAVPWMIYYRHQRGVGFSSKPATSGHRKAAVEGTGLVPVSFAAPLAERPGVRSFDVITAPRRSSTSTPEAPQETAVGNRLSIPYNV